MASRFHLIKQYVCTFAGRLFFFFSRTYYPIGHIYQSWQRGEIPWSAFVYSKLTFKNHTRHQQTSCPKALDILRVVGHTGWRADSTFRFHHYRSLVCSKFNNGSIVNGSTSKSLLKQLGPIHHQDLRLYEALGVFRTPPVQSLYAEVHEPSMSSRRLQLSLNDVIKLN